jgi:hypothetical protein
MELLIKRKPLLAMDEKLTHSGIIMEKILNDIMEQVLRFNTFLNKTILNNTGLHQIAERSLLD